MKIILAICLLALTTSSIAFAEHMGMKEEMAKCDTNKDGMISKDEFMKSKTEVFMKMDTDKNGMLNASEQKMMMDHMHKMLMDDGMKKKDM